MGRGFYNHGVTVELNDPITNDTNIFLNSAKEIRIAIYIYTPKLKMKPKHLEQIM